MKIPVDDDISLRIATTTSFEPLLQRDPRTVFTTVSKAEQSRYRSIVNRTAGLHFLLGRYMLRRALSAESGSGIPPARWEIAADGHGKPRVLNREAASVRFSISHSGTAVAIALSRTHDPGLDLEPLARDHGAGLAARHLLSPAQCDQLRRVPGADRDALLARVWCIKEAVSKACGLGLRLPFPTLEFDLMCLCNADPAGWLECRVRELGRFQFSLHTLARRYLLCVAVTSPVPPGSARIALKPFKPQPGRTRDTASKTMIVPL
ncbi:4'-phosphopantetheinyl transferase family protein [Microbulbifer taiwanensis]|uniref:4'-phosphopantetheinyl transferase family protein n=1 Tax=Microbulbifer taiwanensis TaxID=986746 RepID=A0ABW1YSP0_9GAMM|nr:4'-phosphopantetheinyl transferase superfamily protein [Microbulbifer taiwanensis]